MRKKIVAFLIFFIIFFAVYPVFRTDSEVKRSVFSYFSPVIDGLCDPNYWNDSLILSFHFGSLYFKNNRENLFVLIDFIQDTGNDKTTVMPRNEDSFELIIDWDGNYKITPGIDRMYTLSRKEEKRLIYRYYNGKVAFSSDYYSSGKATPGFSTTMKNKIPHRFYECMIPLSEVKKDTQGYVLFGVKLFSKNPNLSFEEPNNLYEDLTLLHSFDVADADRKIQLDFSIGSRKMSVNSLPITMDVEPFLFQKRAYIPSRYVIEPFGGYFEWNEKERRLVIMIKDKIVEFKINDPYAYINGKKTIIDKFNHSIVPLLIPPGRVFVPMRFLAEVINCKVKWDSKEQLISLIYESS